MDIILYNNSSEKIRVNKQEYITPIMTLTGTLRNQCSVVNPTIIIDVKSSVKVWSDKKEFVVDDYSVFTVYDYMDKFLGCNYVHIPEFNRYYFVDNITSVNQNLWQIDLTVDTLMSFKDDILNLECIVARNEYEYDDMIVDNQLFTKYDNEVIEYEPDDPVNPDYRFTKLGKTSQIFNYPFIIVTRGGWNASGETIIYNQDIISNNEVLPSISNELVAPYFYSFSKSILLLTSILQLQSFLAGLDSKTYSYIDSITTYPFDIEVNNVLPDERDIYLGGHRIGSSTGYGTKYPQSPYIYIADFTIKGDNFKSYEPYSNYELYLPYHGWINLKASDILNNRLIVCYTVDYENVSSSVYVIDATNNKLLYSAACNLGIKFSITQDNSYDINNQRLSNTLNMILGGLSNTIGVGTSVAAGQYGGVAKGGINAINQLSQGIIKNNSLYVTASSTVSSSAEALMTPQRVRVRITRTKTYEPDNYASIYGKPLNQAKKLSTLKGMTVCESFHLEGISTATSSEIDEIDSLLSKGIIL